MGTITTASIIDKAQIILQDTTSIRWPETELLGWLSDGQAEVAIWKPNACTKNEPLKLVAGTKQQIPAGGTQLIDVVRNMGADGSTPGRAIRIAMREILDAQTPDWHTAGAAATVIHFTFNPADPRQFYVYPPQPAAGQGHVEIVYAAAPAAATTGGAITIDDIYANVLLDYILFRAYSKDSEYAANSARASQHQSNYLGALTGKTQTEVAHNPNANAPGNPNVPSNRA